MAQKSPVDLYEASVKNTRKTFAGVKPNQMKDPTPCDKWDVTKLMEHISGGFGMGAGVFASGVGTMEAHDAAKAGLTPADYDKESKRMVELVKKPGMMDKKVKTPMGEMPGGQFLTILFVDNLVHGWDLAKATKQGTNLPKDLVEAAYAAMSPQFADLAKSGAFKPAIKVADKASTQEKLMAGLGRKA